VSAIRAHVEHTLQHPVNHVLIQLYRTGADYISEHSDKTIDVVRGSRIVNLSLGARRTMTLRTKKDATANTTASGNEQGGDDGYGDGAGAAATGVQRTRQRVPLPNNSLFVMGLETNARWMHSVHADKRPEYTKDPAEYGPRISLTFRRIGTFLTPLTPYPPPSSSAGQEHAQVQQLIFGQGATGKSRAEARPVVHGGEDAERLLAAFGAENHQSDFDWEKAYGEGFDVLHFTTGTPV
jgi:2OG-Fe(II) oxygenase superfamily